MLTAVWTWRGWGDLAVLRLPDTDDAMRLQQVRDWLAGQPFADLSQHRLAGGLPLHWSRLPDLPLAALTLLFGERAAVIVWPGLLFAAALTLVARIAWWTYASRITAIVVAALAYPASALFLPGRIDHHGLQLVLLLVVTLGLLGPASRGRGAAMGIAAAVSLLVGLETAPLIGLAMAVVVWEWRGGHGRRLDGVMAGYGVTLAAGALLLRPAMFDWPACDGFTATALRAEAIAAVALAVLALAGRTRVSRTIVLGVTAIVSAGAVIWLAPGCLDPYGGVDPRLARLWLGNVAEAQPLLAAGLPTVVAQAGVALVGLIATERALRRDRTRAWAILLIFQGAAVALAFVQLRAISAAALLAAPALAAMIDRARLRGPAALAAAWLASAGIVYPLAARLLEPTLPPGPVTNCRATLARLATLQPGLVVAPPDIGAWGIAATPHRFLAAPYHRNNAGNGAAYAILIGDPTRAEGIVRRTGTRWLAWCGDLGGVAIPAQSVAGRIARGAPPPWLTKVGDGVLAVMPTAR